MTDSITEYQDDLVRIRRDIHKHPELGFQEYRTSETVTRLLEQYGLVVEGEVAGTGVVGVLRRGRSNRAVGLRADMDALPIEEANAFDHRSTKPGVMHACGHDGHTTMLLGAARYLAAKGEFDGKLVFVFQPAEEDGKAGAHQMIEEGLFERYPVDAIYGMHNLPGLPTGSFATRIGPITAASDNFDVTVIGKGAHAAFPETGLDPIPIAGELVTALQNLVSRQLPAREQAVVSVTQIVGGENYNVIPERVTLKGSVRTFSPDVRSQIEEYFYRTVAGVCGAHGAKHEIEYRRGYPAAINSEDETVAAIKAATMTAGEGCVEGQAPPVMAAEDFAFMLEKKPGCYVFIGNGDGEGSCAVHNPEYDFNDNILVVGARYWVNLVESELAPQKGSTK